MSKTNTHTQTAARRATPDQLLAAANLPAPIPARIASIVRATRLWKSERADIARELIAHAHDALSVGRSPEDTADSLGDPATIAKLLRRSTRRKRPWHWQARHRTLQALAIALLAVIGTYTILFIRFNTGSPDIKHNYLAELNERNIAFTEDQKALPAFEALHLAWSPVYLGLYKIDEEYRKAEGLTDQPQNITAFEHYPYATPDAPLYDRLLEAHASVLPQLNAAIAATKRPVLGMLYSDRSEEVTDENGQARTVMLPPSEDPRLAGPVIEVLLPALSYARQISQLMAFDATHAAHNNKPDRAAESITAVFDTARLVGQEHTLIASLVALAIQTMGETVLLQILHDHPNLLDESHLTAIAHTSAVSGRTARDLDLATERRMFGDFLQRAYTDDGRGDGRLTADGLRLIELYSGFMPDDPDAANRPNPLAARFTGPLTMATSGSRADQREMYNRILNQVESGLRLSPAAPEQTRLRADLNDTIELLGKDRRYWTVMLLAPAFSKSVSAAHKSEAHTNATLTTIALHIHHQRTGRWPDTLAELTPHLLPTIPEDPFDPGQPIKYRVIDGVPHIYFVGANAQDNHATRPTDRDQREVSSLERRYMQGRTSPSPLPADQGDWVIFPPASP